MSCRDFGSWAERGRYSNCGDHLHTGLRVTQDAQNPFLTIKEKNKALKEYSYKSLNSNNKSFSFVLTFWHWKRVKKRKKVLWSISHPFLSQFF